jgi:NADH dehydrogenase (ubiquinone) 1 beta subcomplex subunit 8
MCFAPLSPVGRLHSSKDDMHTRTWKIQTWYALQPALDPPQLIPSTQNGGYISPPPIPRQFRDPYADWWDKQERRNYGEPVHEDNDILGMFAPEEYRHVTPGKAFFLVGCFVASVLALCGVVSLYYPDRPSAPRTWSDGLAVELGGAGKLQTKLVGCRGSPFSLPSKRRTRAFMTLDPKLMQIQAPTDEDIEPGRGEGETLVSK